MAVEELGEAQFLCCGALALRYLVLRFLAQLQCEGHVVRHGRRHGSPASSRLFVHAAISSPRRSRFPAHRSRRSGARAKASGHFVIVFHSPSSPSGQDKIMGIPCAGQEAKSISPCRLRPQQTEIFTAWTAPTAIRSMFYLSSVDNTMSIQDKSTAGDVQPRRAVHEGHRRSFGVPLFGDDGRDPGALQRHGLPGGRTYCRTRRSARSSRLRQLADDPSSTSTAVSSAAATS